MRGAFLDRLGGDSDVNLVDWFYDGGAHVSGVVKKSGEAGDAEKRLPTMPYGEAQEKLKELVQPKSLLYTPLKEFVDEIYKVK